MKFTLGTYQKAAPKLPGKRLGASTFVLKPRELRLLRKLSARLHKLNQSQMTVDLDSEAIALKTPACCGELQDCGIHLRLGDLEGSGHFHFVGRRARDHSLVYTDTVSMKALLAA